MKFPRNARITRSHLDVAPFACVFFLLVIFVLLGSLSYTPGVRLQLPSAPDLSGASGPTLHVALDAGGNIYFQNKNVSEGEFTNRLQAALRDGKPAGAVTLVVQADKGASEENLIRLATLASGTGITNFLLATLPRP